MDRELIYNNWYSSSLTFKIEQHLFVVHSPRMYFPLITNLSPVIFCASLRLADTFCAKIAFTNYIPTEDDYNYHCLFFYAIVKVMFSSSREAFYFKLKFCTDDHKWIILLLANLNAVLYDFRILSFLWMYKLMTYNMKIEMLLIWIKERIKDLL